MNLTDLTLKHLKAPAKGSKTFFDDTLSGFGVRCSQGGTKTYILVHGRARTRVKLGTVGVLTLKQARDAAKTILAEKQLGRYQSRTVLFSVALDLYITKHVEKLKPKTAYETKRLLNKHFRPKLQHERLEKVGKGEITEIISKLSNRPSLARHAHVAISGFFSWAAPLYLEHNPITVLKPPGKNRSRTRVLSDHELRAVWQACSNGSAVSQRFTGIVKLLILTGQRVKQIASLKAEWIDREAKTIEFPPSIMKGNRQHLIGYGDMAAEIIETLPTEGYLFPGRTTHFNGFSKCKAQLNEVCGVTNWTLHDLRRTLRTKLASMKVPREHAERLLDHRSATASEVELIYDRHLYVEEMREACNRWEQKLSSILASGA